MTEIINIAPKTNEIIRNRKLQELIDRVPSGLAKNKLIDFIDINPHYYTLRTQGRMI